MDWTRLTRPELALELSYPAATPQGQPVERDDEPFRDAPRVHLSSPDRQELYVEVVRFDDLAPEDEFREHTAYLAARFGPDSIAPLTETSFQGRPAWSYAFRWTEEGRPMQRAVLLLENGPATYRVVYDPRSHLNAEVIATIAWSVPGSNR